jgi:hypothetical protein
MNEAKLYDPYLTRAIVVEGSEICLHAADTLDFIATCETQDAAILGFDTFKIDRAGTLPLMDGIADFSPREKKRWLAYRTICNRAAATIVSQIIQQKGIENTYFTLSSGMKATTAKPDGIQNKPAPKASPSPE